MHLLLHIWSALWSLEGCSWKRFPLQTPRSLHWHRCLHRLLSRLVAARAIGHAWKEEGGMHTFQTPHHPNNGSWLQLPQQAILWLTHAAMGRIPEPDPTGNWWQPKWSPSNQLCHKLSTHTGCLLAKADFWCCHLNGCWHLLRSHGSLHDISLLAMPCTSGGSHYFPPPYHSTDEIFPTNSIWWFNMLLW